MPTTCRDRRRRTRSALLGSLAAAATLATALPAATPAAAAVEAVPGVRLVGGDISWPNCPKGMGIPSRRSEGRPLPLASASFSVIGLTNGPGFYPNPCLADHVAWARGRATWTAAYAMTTFPTATQRLNYGLGGPWPTDTAGGVLRNAGYQQAVFNVASMRAAGLAVPFVWVDVEPYPTSPWSARRLDNREVVRGAARAYEDNGMRVGFYSYDGGWRAVVGGWRKPAYPAWVPVGGGVGGSARAVAACRRPSFSGGPVLLAQWVSLDRQRDRDVTCARLHGRAGSWHPLTRYEGRRLAVGSQGSAVLALQHALGMPARYVDGRFGLRTRFWVRRFQAAHGVTVSSVTLRSTWRALGAGTWRPERPSRMAEFFTPY